MPAINIDSLPKTARSFGKEKIDFEWTEKNDKNVDEKVTGAAFLLTEISYGASLRLMQANGSDESAAALLAERIRFGEDGNDKVSFERAVELLETGDPMISALMNAAYARLMAIGAEKKAAIKEASTKVKH